MESDRHGAVAVVIGAGEGSRLGRLDRPKAFVSIGGRPMLAWAATAAGACPAVDSLVVVVPGGWEQEAAQSVEACGRPFTVIIGGGSRQASVRAALEIVERDVRTVVVHDAARPFASTELFTAVLDALDENTPGAIPVVAVTDTVKRLHDGSVVGTLDREELGLAQTPQAFHADVLRQAHMQACGSDLDLTDDAAVLEAAGYAVRAIAGDPMNIKVTTPSDLARAQTRIAGLHA